jgi:GNAT superfamily N-acetyltransferase
MKKVLRSCRLWTVRGVAAVITSLVRIEADREFRLDLRKPLVPWPSPPGVIITIASAEQVIAAAEMLLRESGRRVYNEYTDRLRRGHKCFVALKSGNVIGCNWLVVDNERDGPLTITLRSDEVLCTGAFVAPAMRGQTIHTALLHAMLSWAKRSGYVRAYTYVGVGNARSAKTHIRLNWQRSRFPRYVIVSSPLLRHIGLRRELAIGLRCRQRPSSAPPISTGF